MGKLRAKSWMWLMRGWGKKESARSTIGVLTFEISRLMSKAINLWHALGDQRIAGLRDETLRLQGIRKLVSDDDDFLLGLALAETMASVHLLARAVARLGARSTDPVLQSFEPVFADLVENNSDLCRLEYTHKKMDRQVKRMEKFITASFNLYQELDVLAEVENDLRRIQAIPEMNSQGCSLVAFKKRLLLQRQAVKQLQEVSVWNRTYDYVARLLASSLFTIVGRIKHVFGFNHKDAGYGGTKTMGHLSDRFSMSGGLMQSLVNSSHIGGIGRFASGPLLNSRAAGKRRARRGILGRRPFMNRSSVEWNSSPQGVLHMPKGGVTVMAGDEMDGDDTEAQVNIFTMDLSLALFESRRNLLNAPPSTLGGSALAMHYANVIIVIEKLVASPNSIGPDVRDDLYNMLPRSIRAALRMRLRSYAKNLGSSVYDPTLAEEWSDAMTRILEWLAPLAHNMIKWQSDRSFEQQNFVSSTNVLLLQTLYYANQTKAEAAITELLVGLNYLWRFGRELNAKAVLNCVGSRDFDDRCNRNRMIHLVGNV